MRGTATVTEMTVLSNLDFPVNLMFPIMYLGFVAVYIMFAFSTEGAKVAANPKPSALLSSQTRILLPQNLPRIAASLASRCP